MKWVRLNRYCELTGETEDSVKHKRVVGMWAESVHWKNAPDGRIWINTEAVDKWLDQAKAKNPERSRAA